MYAFSRTEFKTNSLKYFSVMVAEFIDLLDYDYKDGSFLYLSNDSIVK